MWLYHMEADRQKGERLEAFDALVALEALLRRIVISTRRVVSCGIFAAFSETQSVVQSDT